VLSAAGLVWLKEAGIGVVIGLALWLLLRRPACWALRVAMVAGGAVVLLLPVVVARLSAGVPLAGSRYSQELGGYYHGGLLDRLLHVAPHALWQLLSTALPATLVPYLSPLPIDGHAPDLWKALSWHISLCAVVGAVVWGRRYRDAAIVIVPVYLAETLLWPYINERRVILVLPVLAVWYVLGAQAIGRAVWAAWTARSNRSARSPASSWPVAAGSVVAAVLVIAPLLAQLPRDYLLDAGQDTSHFAGSRYTRILAHLGTPADPVETDYLSSTALYTGHQTRGFAFTATLTSCDVDAVRFALAEEQVGYLLLGDLNKPGGLDSPCLYSTAASSPWAVQLLRTNRDRASVFELIGPGTGHPDLRDLTRSAATSRRVSADGVSTFEWDWTGSAPVSQVTVGEAAAGSATRSVVLQMRDGRGSWQTIAGSPSAVGDGKDAAPYLLATPSGRLATGIRVMISGEGPASVEDVHALGPGNPLQPAPAGRSGAAG
jgi:hypothetical protein